MMTTLFSQLDPDSILTAAETFTGLKFDGTLTPYNSYVNRVFGLTDEDGSDHIIKFYRPGRWTADAILDEHRFLADCMEYEVPVVPPEPGTQSPAPDITAVSPTLGQIHGIYFAVFPRLRARSFDIYTDDDWLRSGRALGRLHLAAQAGTAPNRLQYTPQQTTIPYIRSILKNRLIVPELIPEFIATCDKALDYIEAVYARCFGEPAPDGYYRTPFFQRIHGDCHRGNILEQYTCGSPANTDTEESGTITFIDFDDMMTGPAIQDIWLLLPGYRKDSTRELNMLLEGYEEFSSAPVRKEISLIEPLRFMRHIYFLAWTAIQYRDEGFAERNPGWGSKAFWETEVEDLKIQADILEEEYRDS